MDGSSGVSETPQTESASDALPDAENDIGQPNEESASSSQPSKALCGGTFRLLTKRLQSLEQLYRAL